MRLDDASVLLGDRLPEGSVYHLLAVEGQRLFPDDYFADLFMASAKGRPTVRRGWWRPRCCCRRMRASPIGRRWSISRSTCGGRRRPGWRWREGRFIPRCWWEYATGSVSPIGHVG